MSIEEKKDPKNEENNKDNVEKHDENLPNTKNSSTMTCLENQFQSWPPHVYLPQHPFNGGFFSTPLPAQQLFYSNPCHYNGMPFQNVSTFPQFCNRTNTTQSATSVGSPQSTQSNMSNASVSSSGTTEESAKQNYFQTLPFSLTSTYNPYQMWCSPMPVMLSPGQIMQSSQPNGRHTEVTNVNNPLCSNCSKGFISVHDEVQVGNIPIVVASNVTSFVDSQGRLWRCVNSKMTKPRATKVKERVDTSRVGVSRPGTCVATMPRLSERSDLEESARIPRARKCRRGRKSQEEVSVAMKPLYKSTSRSPPSKSHCLKLRKHNPIYCHRSKRGQSSNGSALVKKELSIENDNKSEEKDSSTQKPTFESEEGLHNNEKITNQSFEKVQSASSFTPDIDKTHPLHNENEDVSKCVPSSCVSHTPSEDGRKPHVMHGTTSCNELRKRGTVKKIATTNQYKHDSNTNEEELWSSSSSGTYDDSEAFDCFKLLSDIKQQRHNIDTNFKQSRQHSRDRLLRKKGMVGSARSEEGFKDRQRSASPPSKETVNRSKEQIIVDTSQVRITEETPKRFIVESKKDSSTPKSMTITVQADRSCPGPLANGNICEFCSMERREDSSCECHVPPCQRPQWQTSLCQANEIHGTPVHCRHDTPPRPPRHIVTSRSEADENETTVPDRVDEYRRQCRRQNQPSFSLGSPWNHRNADRPHEENRHSQFHATVERFESIRRDHALPTNRRRWYTQEPPLNNSRVTPPAEEMLRIQIPSTFPRYRLYDYPRTNEDEGENNEGNEGNNVNRNRNTIDINIFRTGTRKFGTNSRRSTRSNSPRSKGHGGEEVLVPEEDPDNNQDFYRRPRSAITVRKTNFFSRRNQKLEEEVQRIESGNDGWNTPSTSSAKDGKEDYPTKADCQENRGFQGGEKPDSEYEEIEVKLDPKRHRGVEDEEDD